MIKPMLAESMDKVSITNWNDWAVEQKFDGWRVIIHVGLGVEVWTRPRRRANGDKSMKRIELPDLPPGQLPTHLHEAVAALPAGVYDGELLGGKTSTDVGARKYQRTLRLVVFDLLRFGDVDCMTSPYSGRRAHLESLLRGHHIEHVTLAQSISVTCTEDVKKVFDHVRNEGGEGVMLKRKEAPYQQKRSKDLIKMKNLETCVCTVVGFETSRGKVLARGQFATVVLEDANGNPTSVKTKDDAELAAFNCHTLKNIRPLDTSRYPKEVAAKFRKAVTGSHPAIGRKLRIEFQDFTPKSGYRHPRWDRWEDE
jgi:ATP-dependent DNA ligase